MHAPSVCGSAAADSAPAHRRAPATPARNGFAGHNQQQDRRTTPTPSRIAVGVRHEPFHADVACRAPHAPRRAPHATREASEHESPEEDRSLERAPQRDDREEERRGAAADLRDVRDAEVVRDQRVDHRERGDARAAEVDVDGRVRAPARSPAAAGGARRDRHHDPARPRCQTPPATALAPRIRVTAPRLAASGCCTSRLGFSPRLRRAVLVRVLHHQVVDSNTPRRSVASFDDDAHAVAEHLRRRAASSAPDVFDAVGDCEAQVERLRVPHHRPGHDLPAQPDRDVVRAVALAPAAPAA